MTLKIAVCLKQVPDVTEIKINPQTNTLIREGVDAITNQLDLFAVEAAVQLQQQYKAFTTAFCMGPGQAEESLQEALGMGIQEAILLSDMMFSGSDTWATSFVLAQAIKKSGANLVICGKQATDGDTAQVGPGIAAHLGWTQACYVCKITKIDTESITVERLLDYGREELKLQLPAVITVVKDINKTRLTNLDNLLDSWEKPLTIWNADSLNIKEQDCGLSGSPTRVKSIFAPKNRGKVNIIKGNSSREKAEQIAQIINKAR